MREVTLDVLRHSLNAALVRQAYADRQVRVAQKQMVNARHEAAVAADEVQQLSQDLGVHALAVFHEAKKHVDSIHAAPL